jgi:hypothetical protein
MIVGPMEKAGAWATFSGHRLTAMALRASAVVPHGSELHQFLRLIGWPLFPVGIGPETQRGRREPEKNLSCAV